MSANRLKLIFQTSEKWTVETEKHDQCKQRSRRLKAEQKTAGRRKMSQTSGLDQNEQIRRSYRGNIVTIAGSSAVNALGGGIISTYVSLYFVSIGGDPITLGIMASVAAIVQCFVLFLGGFIADYYGRKRIIVITGFYGILFPLMYAFFRDWRIFVIAAIMGSFGAISSPASHATVADSIPQKNRTTGIASLQVISSFPMIFAPPIGGWLIQEYGITDGFRLACMFTAGAALASAMILTIFLRETLPKKEGANTGTPRKSMLKDFGKRISNLPSSLKALLVSYGLVAFANGLVGQFFILYAIRIIGLKPLDWGIIVSLQFLVATFLRIPGGWASDRFGKKKMMTLSILTCTPCTIMFVLSNSFIQAAVSALLLVTAGIYYAPAHEALQADLTPREVRGQVTAFWDIDTAISAALGALTGGILFQTLGPATPFYLFTAVELAAAALIIAAVKEPTNKEN
jgi:MFS family permease